jgi:Uma2 family endonuclease
MSLIAAKWSLDDYHQMIESGLLDNRSLELINGEIIQMSPEGVSHSFYCRGQLNIFDRFWAIEQKLVKLTPLPYPMTRNQSQTLPF